MELPINQIMNGDALQHLKELPDQCINMVMTSPPYWALRDYGIEGQLGLERTFEEYINRLCNIFDEVKRILKKDGTIWINIGDTYMGNSSYSKKGRQGYEGKDGMINKKQWLDPKYPHKEKLRGREHIDCVLPEKSLCMIPFRFAIEMVNRGWILRNTIIWHKPNAMPSSVKDRFNVDFEYLFFFSKKKDYYFEQQFEPHKNPTDVNYRKELRQNKFYNVKQPYRNNVPYSVQPREKEFVDYRNLPDLKQLSIRLNEEKKRLNLTIEHIELMFSSQAPHHWFSAESYPTTEDWNRLKEFGFNLPEFDKQMTEIYTKSAEKTTYEQGRNKRTVWEINTKPLIEAHFATYPEELCESPIKSGCPEFICNRCGKPREMIQRYTGKDIPKGGGSCIKYKSSGLNLSPTSTLLTRTIKEKEIVGYSDCGCNAGFHAGIVLDMFFGAGTTGLVALKQNKKFIGIELNPEYIEIAKKRLEPLLSQTKLNYAKDEGTEP